MDSLMELAIPFQLLFSDETAAEPSLPDELRALYPGDWHLPELADRPYIYSNFVTSRDGRISYNHPDHPGGGPISRFSVHDRWLMALLRMRAHAVLIGDVTLDIEPEHDWTAEFIYPPGAEIFGRVRREEGYGAKPLLVLLSFDGKLNFDADCWQDKELHILVATTEQGAINFGQHTFPARVDVLDLGENAVDLIQLTRQLFQDYGVRHLLCEGGATVFANMLDAHLIDEEFVTLSPVFVGRRRDVFRPSYTENVAWLPPEAPLSKPFSLHRAGDCLYLRTRCVYPDAIENISDALRMEPLSNLPSSLVKPLLQESRAQGFRFVDTLVDEYESGANRFDRPGEVLYGVFAGENLIAVGGLNRDPYVQDESVGRVRHLYVLADWRRHGVGRQVVERIITDARMHFRLLTLRTFDDEADRFYRALGFAAEPAMESASHHLRLDGCE